MDESQTPDSPEEEAPESAEQPEQGGATTEGEESFQAAEFQDVTNESKPSANGARPDVELILDVPVTLALEVGRTEMTIGNLLGLSQGAVVELDRNAGEPLDVIANGALIARGEIVVVNDKFGIRLIDVIAAPERAVPAKH